MKYFAVTMVVLATLFCASPVVADEPTADEYKTFFDHLVGTWAWSSGDATGTLTFNWSGDKCALVGEGRTSDGAVFGTILDFYNPKFKCWNRMIVWQDGHVSNVHIPVPAKTLQGELRDLTLQAETETIGTDGSSKDGRTVFRIIDRNNWEVDQTDGSTVIAKRK
jgi:hypothetical protein